MQTTIPELLSAQADALTTKPFMQVWAEGEGIVLTLSFSEFRQRVQCAAAALRQQAGVTAGQRTAMLSHPSVSCFVYSTAIMWLGAVAVQLNWRQPIEMLLSMMKTAEAPGALLASPIFCAEARSLRGGAHGPQKRTQDTPSKAKITKKTRSYKMAAGRVCTKPAHKR